MAFADENGVDTDDVTTRADGIKVPYCKSDPVYWFRRLEIQMQIRKIKSQFWKRVVLEANLPPELNEQIKDYLILEESEAATVYKDCKARLLKINAPKPEEDVALAMGLVMTGLPSQAGKRLKELICKAAKFKDCPCCPAVVGKLWRDMLPQAVRDAVANYDLNVDFDKAMDHADRVFNARKSSKSSTVAAVDLDETAPALQHDVAAVTQKKKKFDPKDRQTWGKYHKDFNGKSPPSKICHLHYRWGKQAYSCKAPGVCPWENYTIPKPK